MAHRDRPAYPRGEGRAKRATAPGRPKQGPIRGPRSGPFVAHGDRPAYPRGEGPENRAAAPGRPKQGPIPSGDRPAYPRGEGLS